MTLACEDANSKLVEVTVANVDSEDHVGNSLLQIWELTFELAIWLWQDELNPRVRCAFGNVLVDESFLNL